MTPWSPTQTENGWFPHLSPSGTHVLYGFWATSVANLLTGVETEVLAPRSADGHRPRLNSLGWLDDVTFIAVTEEGPAAVYSYDLSTLTAPTQLDAPEYAGTSFAGAGNGSWGVYLARQDGSFAYCLKNGQPFHPEIAQYGIAVNGDHLLTADKDADYELMHFVGDVVVRRMPSDNKWSVSAHGDVTTGYYGEVRCYPWGEGYVDATITPWRREGPGCPLRVNGELWLWTEADEAEDGLILGRRLGETDPIVLSGFPSVASSVVWTGTEFIIAGNSDKGHLQVRSSSIDAPREKLVMPVEPPVPPVEPPPVEPPPVVVPPIEPPVHIVKPPMPPKRPLMPPSPDHTLRGQAVWFAIWNAYWALLGRAPDPFGINYYTSMLTEGGTVADMEVDIKSSAEYRDSHPGEVPVPPVGSTPDMHQWPKFGGSYQNGLCNPACDPVLFAALNRDAGGDFTRIWAYDAWAVGPNGPGQYAGFVPWLRDGDGVFDLERPDLRYDERLNAYVRAQNAAGATVQITVLELYGWSERKAGMLWVPDADVGPFRRNRNGVRWGGPDDPTFFTLPDWVLEQFIERLCAATKGLAVCFEVGNEMPEKDMHKRISDSLRSHFTADWYPDITVNRQEDTPGQYVNMEIGRKYDRIALHGKYSLGYLDEDYEREPVHRTFRSAWGDPSIDHSRIIMSSDGCRSSATLPDTYDWPVLAEVVKDHLRRGFSYEHQSKCKMRPFLEGRLDLRADFEVAWLQSLRQ